MTTRAIDLRIALEDLGATLTLEGRRLVIAPPLAGIPVALTRHATERRAALATLVALYPCRGCGRESFIGACSHCPRRRRGAR
jgi:hypothetical protein